MSLIKRVFAILMPTIAAIFVINAVPWWITGPILQIMGGFLLGTITARAGLWLVEYLS